MSVRCISRVWEQSKHAGTELLMLLAIADFADDQGNAYPAVSTLATKCRMQPRNARYILSTLQESGELEVQIAAGPRGANRYRINFQGMQSIAGGLQAAAGVQESAAPLQAVAATPATDCRNPLQPVAAKPSLNRHEPSDVQRFALKGRRGSQRLMAAKLPSCPHQKLLKLYSEHLPGLPQPQPELWGGQRAKHLASRWQWLLTATKRTGERYACTEEEALEWFGRFFAYVGTSDFLTGRNGRFNNCDLGWLVKQENFAKVVQGNYENREAA